MSDSPKPATDLGQPPKQCACGYWPHKDWCWMKTLAVKAAPIQPDPPKAAPAAIEHAPQKFYVASRASLPERPAMWKRFRDQGVRITSSWIDEAEPGATADLGELWARIWREIADADCLVLYVEMGDFPLKGALIEAGITLGMGKPIRIVAPECEFPAPSYRPIGSWVNHPRVQFCTNLNQAFGRTDAGEERPAPTPKHAGPKTCFSPESDVPVTNVILTEPEHTSPPHMLFYDGISLRSQPAYCKNDQSVGIISRSGHGLCIHCHKRREGAAK